MWNEKSSALDIALVHVYPNPSANRSIYFVTSPIRLYLGTFRRFFCYNRSNGYEIKRLVNGFRGLRASDIGCKRYRQLFEDRPRSENRDIHDHAPQGSVADRKAGSRYATLVNRR
jgi:hypothetical protein